MRQQGRTSPRTPYSTEYRNRKGFSQTIEDHGERLTNVELRANQTPLPGETVVEVRKDGVPVGAHNILDLIEGANITLTVSDDGQVIRIEIAGAAGSSGYDTIEDEGTPLAQETVIDFQGAGVTATAGAGKTIVTIPGGSSSGGGVVAYDAVVDPNYTGSDGDTTTLATDSVVFIYTTVQAAVDAYENGDYCAGVGATILLNRGSYSEAVVISENQPGNLTLTGPMAALVPGGDMSVSINSITVRSSDYVTTLQNIHLSDSTVGLSAGLTYDAATNGMRVNVFNCTLGGIRGALRDSLWKNVIVQTDWILDADRQGIQNAHSRFRDVVIQGPVGGATDCVIDGLYTLEGGTLASGLTLPAASGKHWVFTDYEFGADVTFEIDGGSVTIELYGCRWNGNNLIITDTGGGGTVVVIMNGGEGGGSPLIDSASTVVVNAVVDGIVLIGAAPHFRGQFVDSSFGGCSPPSYVVEFL